MVKFAKNLELQLVPEWGEAYVSYKRLKKNLNKICRTEAPQGNSGLGINLLRPANRESKKSWISSSHGTEPGPAGGAVLSPRRSTATLSGGAIRRSGSEARLRKQQQHKYIDVQVERGGATDGWAEVFHTNLLAPFNDSAGEATFFEQMDVELNKVNAFFTRKEREYLARFRQLERQIAALSQLKLSDSKDCLSSDSIELRGWSSSRDFGRSPQVGREDKPGTWRARNAGSHSPAGEQPGEGFDAALDPREDSLTETENDAPPSELPRPDHLRLDLPAATPLLTIQRAIRRVQEDLARRRSSSSASEEEDKGANARARPAGRAALRSAERMLREALREFYRGLGLLREYSSLNLVAFEKILKKHDKRLGCHTARTYLDAVRRAHFQSSTTVLHMTAVTETLFVQHFANNSHRAAMQELRPMHRSSSHVVTYALGFLSGLLVALAVTFIVMLATSGGYDQAGGPGYLESVFPVFSGLILLLVHMYMYGLNTYWWRLKHINYAFIFELRPKHELRFREVLLASNLMTAVTLGGMVLHLVSTSESGNSHGDYIPLIVWAVWFAVLVCPFNCLWRSSRALFGRTMLRVVLAPFYHVALADFFMGDQLTSQIPFLQCFQYFVCYYGAGHFRTRDGAACTSNPTYGRMLYVVAILPYWFRFAQCWRRYLEEGRMRAHVFNAGKYLSALVAITCRLWYLESQSSVALVLGVFTAIVATIAQSYWDLVVDWGLLRARARHAWLRDQLILKREWVYFVAMVVNVLLRLAWIQSIVRFRISRSIHENVVLLGFAALEVVRRGIWNFFRIENEHLNNVGMFRAVRSIPLPFKDAAGMEV